MTQKKIGRPETLARRVRELVEAAGDKGINSPEIRQTIKVTGSQIKHCMATQTRLGYLYSMGPMRHQRYFWASVDREIAYAVVDAEAIAWKAFQVAQRQHWDREANDRRRAARAEARAVRLKDQFEAREQAKKQKEKAFADRAAARMAAAVKKSKKATCAVNKLADKYRGTASPKEPSKRGPQVTGFDSAPRTVCQPCRGRYDPEPGFVGSLSNLPFGVYAEPAGFVARAFLEAA